MEFNRKYLVFIIILLIIVIGFILCVQPNDGEVKVNHTTFTIPESYHEGNSFGDVINITDGYYTVFIQECGSKEDIEDFVNSYIAQQRENNNSVVLSNFTVNNVFVYKTTLINGGSNHYWFEYNDYTYTICNWEQNGKMDELVKDLIIKSLK